MARQLTIYLDTQDYSLLSDARAGRGTEETRAVLKRLLELKGTGLVRFVYSATQCLLCGLGSGSERGGISCRN